MENKITLNELYLNYRKDLLKKNDFEAAVFIIIKDDICRHIPPGWIREDYDDFVSWSYFRLRRAINSYRDVGSSFETYIGSVVRVLAKEYRLRQIRNNVAEAAVWVTQLPEMGEAAQHVCEEAPEYDDGAVNNMPDTIKNRRQLLILILKCCSYVSMDFLEKITPKLGLDMETINEMIDHLKHKKKKREDEIKLLRERVNCQFYRCILYEKNLRGIDEDTKTAWRLQERLKRGRKRLNNMRKRLEKARIEPSNGQIAEVLGVSKGTIDSALYNIKARWSNIEKNLNGV